MYVLTPRASSSKKIASLMTKLMKRRNNGGSGFPMADTASSDKRFTCHGSIYKLYKTTSFQLATNITNNEKNKFVAYKKFSFPFSMKKRKGAKK